MIRNVIVLIMRSDPRSLCIFLLLKLLFKNFSFLPFLRISVLLRTVFLFSFQICHIMSHLLHQSYHLLNLQLVVRFIGVIFN
jgi:hypothetical protein